jgi:hypothetical protein
MRGNGFAFGTAPIHNPEAETAVLGALIINPEARARIGDLHPECFFNLQLRRAFEVVSARIAADALVDPVTLKAVFAADPDLGEDLLAALVGCAATPINAGEYARELRRVRRLRDFDWLADDLRAFVRQQEPGEDPAEYVTRKLRELPGDDADLHTIPYTLFADARPLLTNLWLVKGILPRRGVAVIYGPSGGGKTFVALDMLLHIARGVAWRGRKTARAAVLYLAPDGGSVVANRLAAYRRHHGITDGDLVVVSSAVDLLGKVSAGDLGRVDGLIAHVERVHDMRIAVIVVDTVSRAMPGGDENQPADMSRFVDNLGRLSAGGERLTVGIHHTPKSDDTILRGHSSLHGAADCELNVVDQTIRVAKQRDGEDGIQFGFRLEVVEIGRDEDGDAVTSCVAVASDVAATKRITGAASIALRLLHNAIIDAGETPPACTHIPSNVLSVRMEIWRRYCDSGQVSDGDTPDARRKAFKRAAVRLQELGAIGVWGGWAWPADNRT